eukprot:CAMPEP_0176087632 /NCGR_PEP_ID=MMETSP0120_2-20121206/43873_1 /TAXON_ID=160619 /ORGANISM="Kryptoperidinium foliaceum, Strain CCMP 1326" /LENGTH=160 /DNA_ID=CAMNT_0017421479 /DNA_START=89 /DNA_END=567 /DNA_ORIENTATION=-
MSNYSTRRSRWGDRPTGRSAPSQNHNNHQAASSSQGVSDDEALRALMTSAQEREQERSSFRTDNRKRGRDQSRPDRGRNDNRQHRDGPRGQRLPENDSYYGPGGGEDRRQRPRREEAPNGPAKVEPEEGTTKQETKRKRSHQPKKQILVCPELWLKILEV